MELACYLCLQEIDHEATRFKDLKRCHAPRHAYLFHPDCGKTMDSCVLCRPAGPKPVALLCSNALRKLLTEQEVTGLRLFLQEVARLCRRDDKGAYVEEVTSALYEGRACEVMYMVMSRCPLEEPDLALAAMRALTALADTGYRDTEQRLGATEGPYRLCRTIEHQISQIEVALAGLEAMVALVQNDAALLVMLEGSRALGVVVAVIKAFYMTEPRVWGPGLRALRATLRHNVGPDHDGSIPAVKMLSEMLKVCCRVQSSMTPAWWREIKLLTCQVVADISTDEVSTKALFDSSACRYLCILLTTSRAEEDIQLSACRAVCNLSIHCSEARTFLGNYMPALLRRMLDTHWNSTAAVEAALRAITSLCCNKNTANAEALGEGPGGMCALVVESLQRNEEPIALEAVRAFGVMCFMCPGNAQRFKTLKASDALRACQHRFGRLANGAVFTEEVAMDLRTLQSALGGASVDMEVSKPQKSSAPSRRSSPTIHRWSGGPGLHKRRAMSALAGLQRSASSKAALPTAASEMALPALSPRQMAGQEGGPQDIGNHIAVRRMSSLGDGRLEQSQSSEAGIEAHGSGDIEARRRSSTALSPRVSCPSREQAEAGVRGPGSGRQQDVALGRGSVHEGPDDAVRWPSGGAVAVVMLPKVVVCFSQQPPLS